MAGVWPRRGAHHQGDLFLSREYESKICDAIRLGTVLETVTIHPNTRLLDFDDGALTENTRAAYRANFIPGAAPDGVCQHAVGRIASRRVQSGC